MVNSVEMRTTNINRMFVVHIFQSHRTPLCTFSFHMNWRDSVARKGEEKHPFNEIINFMRKPFVFFIPLRVCMDGNGVGNGKEGNMIVVKS